MRSNKRITLTIVFIISLTPMLMNQYGGCRGVQEITGMINLTNPIGIIALLAFFTGIWAKFESENTGKFLGLAGTIGIVVSEIYKFFTWHVLTITGEISLQNSVELAYPEFYIGLLTSIAMVIIYIIYQFVLKDEDVKEIKE